MIMIRRRNWIAVLICLYGNLPTVGIAQELPEGAYTYLDAAQDSATRAGAGSMMAGAVAFGGALYRFEGRNYLDFVREPDSGRITQGSLRELDERVQRAWSGSLRPKLEVAALRPDGGPGYSTVHPIRLDSPARGAFATKIMELEQSGYRIASVTIVRNGAGQAIIRLLVYRVPLLLSGYSALHLVNTWRHLQRARSNRDATICFAAPSSGATNLGEQLCEFNPAGIFTGITYEPRSTSFWHRLRSQVTGEGRVSSPAR